MPIPSPGNSGAFFQTVHSRGRALGFHRITPGLVTVLLFAHGWHNIHELSGQSNGDHSLTHSILINLFINQIDACAARNRPWQTLAFLPLLTSSLLTKVATIYTQLLQEEKIFPMMPRSEWSTKWSLRYAQKYSKSWVKNSEQNFLPLHLAAPC